MYGELSSLTRFRGLKEGRADSSRLTALRNGRDGDRVGAGINFKSAEVPGRPCRLGLDGARLRGSDKMVAEGELSCRLLDSGSSLVGEEPKKKCGWRNGEAGVEFIGVETGGDGSKICGLQDG